MLEAVFHDARRSMSVVFTSAKALFEAIFLFSIFHKLYDVSVFNLAYKYVIGQLFF